MQDIRSLILIFLLAGCSGKPPGQPVALDTASKKDSAIHPPEIVFVTGDSVAKEDSLPDEDFAFFIEKNMRKWLRYEQQAHPGLNLHSFSRSNPHGFSSIRNVRFTRPKNHDDSLNQLLGCVSPKGNFIVDIYSQRYIWEEKGKTILSGGDPESGINLVCLRDSSSHLIEYTGSEEGYDDVAWIDNERFLVTGYNNYFRADSIQLDYKVYNLRTKTLICFSSAVLPAGKKQKHSFLCLKFPDYCDE